MKKLWQGGACVGLLVVFAVAVLVLQSDRQTAQGGTGYEAQSSGSPHYSVLTAEGHNLLVTDNATNKLFFYTTDKDAPLGSPLKLRASLDLTKVGGPEITITPHNLEKFEPKKK
jgi:6-phosphogluconolactonase (cycloisomerase 2 family)